MHGVSPTVTSSVATVGTRCEGSWFRKSRISERGNEVRRKAIEDCRVQAKEQPRSDPKSTQPKSTQDSYIHTYVHTQSALRRRTGSAPSASDTVIKIAQAAMRTS